MHSMIGAVVMALVIVASLLAVTSPLICSSWYLLLFTLLVCSLGINFAIWGHVILSSPFQAPAVTDIVERDVQEFKELLEKNINALRTSGSKDHSSHLPVVFGRTVDGLLQQLIDLVLRDFLLVWLKEHCYKADVNVTQLKKDVWGAVQRLHERLSRVDIDRLIAVDMVTKVTIHFEKIRIAHSCSMESNELPVFSLSPHLMSSQRELHYLRQISELLIVNLMPSSYALSPVSHLLREILVCKIFQPSIDLLTEPDYLNQKILTYLEGQKAVAEMHVKTHNYAQTFEDFLKMINSCNDVDALKRIRYNIMSEIMQATTLQNVKRARGIDIEELEKGGANVTRQQTSAARKIKCYITQLSHAKAQCEQALLAHGWEGAFPLHRPDSTQSESETLALGSVLESVTGRRYISTFLETVCSQGLVGFWTAVEELRYSHRSNWHQLGAEIFYTYIRSPCAEIKVDKDTWKRMEAFLLGDKGPEVFYEVQQLVFDTIHDKYYSAFVLSDQYKAMAKALLSEEVSVTEDLSCEKSPLPMERQLSSESISSAESVGAGMLLADSTYARLKLEQLQERLSNKTQALRALRASLRPGCRALQLLEREVERLAGERRRLEAHLARADAWADNLGRWRANVVNAEIIEECKPPQFVIVVHVSEEEEKGVEEDCRPEGITTGWVLLRTLSEFQDLHRKLKPMCPQIKNLDLPNNSCKFLFGKNNKNSLDKAKLQIQKYLEFVLEDDKLNQSEALYTFLSPSSEYFKHSAHSLPKKTRFSFSTLFKSGSNESNLRANQERDLSVQKGAVEEEISLSLDGEGEGEVNNSSGVLWSGPGQEDGNKDAIAEPLYSLLGEVFDMRGVFKWLRRTLISFVQITYGRTINRQIRDTVGWLFSEQMLHYYISVAIKAWWPGSVLCKSVVDRTHPDKEETHRLAREQFISNVPEVLTSLVGAQTAQRGAQKVFDTLQNAPQNKQLFYVFEIIIKISPEKSPQSEPGSIGASSVRGISRTKTTFIAVFCVLLCSSYL